MTMIGKSGIKYPSNRPLYAWNPLWGCTYGCSFCYAEKWNKGPYGQIDDFRKPEWNENTFNKLFPKKPADILVMFQSDPAELDGKQWVKIINKINDHPQHRFFMLSKRPKQAYMGNAVLMWPENLWLGFSATNQTEYEIRLSQMPYPEYMPSDRFNTWCSLEPLSGPIDLMEAHSMATPAMPSLTVVGGMSGANAKPMNHDWVKQIVKQHPLETGYLTFKQWSAANPGTIGENGYPVIDGEQFLEWPES